MSNCVHTSVVTVHSISFQVRYFKKSRADAVKTLLNTDLTKKNFAPPAKISTDAHERELCFLAQASIYFHTNCRPASIKQECTGILLDYKINITKD